MRDTRRLPTIERHVFLSDLQIPDHDDLTMKAVEKFLEDFKPHVLHLVGDILNLTKVSKYDQDAYYDVDLVQEVEAGRAVLKHLTKLLKKINPAIRIMFYEGNHEARLLRYLSNNAPQLAKLADEDGYVLSLPRLLKLKELGITWIPYFKHHVERGNVVVEHGDIARAKAGYTAHAMLDRRGSSGVSGHTHRLALICRTQGDHERFWVENGSLCRRNMSSPYTKKPDWIQGFSIGLYDSVSRLMHPSVIPIFEHQFAYGGRIYKP